MKFIFSFLFTVFGFISSGQYKIVNHTLADSTVNIFYIGIENKIQIKGLQPADVVTISGAGGTLRKVGKNEFLAYVSKIGRCDVYIVKSGKIAFKVIYKIDTIPNPVASLNGFFNTSLSKNEILFNPYLRVVFPGSFLQSNTSILSFSAVFVHDADSTATQWNSNTLSEDQIKWIRKLQKGDKILFTEIRVSEISSRTRKLDPFWIEIK